MFIHNNIFYSQGYDGLDRFDKYGGESAAHVAVSKDIDAIQDLNKLDIDCVRTLGTVLIDNKGQRIIAQTIIPGILKKTAEHESAILYGSVDGGDEIVTSEKSQEVVQKVSNALYIERQQG